MRKVAIASAVALLLAIAGPEVIAGLDASAADPARVAGAWDYRTRSNCGGGTEGSGAVSFAWNPAEGGYDERGSVTWPHTGQTISWWGVTRFDPRTRELRGRMLNTLGDEVDGHWQLEGPGPDRLVVRWEQTNGRGSRARAPGARRRVGGRAVRPCRRGCRSFVETWRSRQRAGARRRRGRRARRRRRAPPLQEGDGARVCIRDRTEPELALGLGAQVAVQSPDEGGDDVRAGAPCRRPSDTGGGAGR